MLNLFWAALTPVFPLPQFGVLTASNRLEWNGVVFPIPGAEKFPTTTTLRITNIRGNQSLLGSSNPVSALVSISGQVSIPVKNSVLTCRRDQVRPPA